MNSLPKEKSYEVASISQSMIQPKKKGPYLGSIPPS